MTRYPVYLEIDPSGLTMAHVAGLPGCIVRASDREQALHRLPASILSHHAWLRHHGEDAPTGGETPEIEVAGESWGFGPFMSGDMAALFPPDQDPISLAEMEPFFRLMAHSRADLLDLVANLPDDVLDWHPDPDTRTIRQVLRHVGNAEEWYVSRIVAAEALPPEWEQDQDLPIFEFLKMERRATLDLLRELGEEERSRIFHPARWTRHPEEPWTARKVLRRFLEHEREHTEEVREHLGLHRRHLLAHLAAARSGLLERLAGLEGRLLSQEPACGEWTNQDVLVHIAAWDRWARRQVGGLVAGEPADLSAMHDIDGYNATNVAAWRGRPLEEVVEELQGAHSAWVAWLEALDEAACFQPRLVGKRNWSPPFWIEVLRHHDAEHAEILDSWRATEGVQGKCGPQALLMAALEASRQELLAAAALVPEEGRCSRPVCGAWTLKDVLGHIADWEHYCVAGLRDMAAGRPPQAEYVADEEAWNRAHARNRRDQPWEEVWADFVETHQALLGTLKGMGTGDLARTFPGVWEKETTPYAWATVGLVHDREHAEDIRDALTAQAGLALEPPSKSWTSRGQ